MNQQYSVLAAKLVSAFICFIFFLTGSTIAQLPAGCPHDVQGLHDYENPLYDRWLSAYDLKYYLLDLNVDNRRADISGSADILLEGIRSMDTLVFELQEALTVSAVSFAENALDENSPVKGLAFQHIDGVLYVSLTETLQPGSLARISIEYGGNAGNSNGFFSGLTSREDWVYGFDVTYTLSEPFNASHWFPAKQVLEDKIDSVSIRLRCRKDLMAASNGLLVDLSEDGNDHVFHWESHYPIAYYLISFAVADYRDYSFYAPLSTGEDSVLIQNYIYDDDRVLEDWEEEILISGEMISTFSRLFTDYPFAEEKYGHAMAPMGGGMEHQTMTTIQDFDFHLVAHELAHQWFGDHITCGSWQDIWINEGFASYSEYIASQELQGQRFADMWMENAMSLALSEVEGSVFVPEDQVDDTRRLFSFGLSYKKGAILLHMIRFILDDDQLFFTVLRDYLEEFGSADATGDEFREVLERVSGEDFSCFFEQWYYGEGYPRFELHWIQRGDSLLIECEQSGSAPSATPFFKIPFEVDLLMSGGERIRVRLDQTTPRQDYLLQVEGRVEQLLFDPDLNLLKTATVIQKLPGGKPYRYGPNPVAGELFLQFPNTGEFSEVKITSLSGQEMLRISEASNPLTMDMSAVSEGAYLLEFTNSQGTFVERIVKVKSR